VRAERLIEFSLGCGFTQFDTAPLYGSGQAERALGSVLIASKSWRSTVKIDTKFGYSTSGERVSLTRTSLRKNLFDSLRRLRVDSIRTYYWHSPDPNELGALNSKLDLFHELIEEGLIEYVGVSLRDPGDIGCLLGLRSVAKVVVQCSFSIADQRLLHYLKVVGDTPNLTLIARSVLNQGFLPNPYLYKTNGAADDLRSRYGKETLREKCKISRFLLWNGGAANSALRLWNCVNFVNQHRRIDGLIYSVFNEDSILDLQRIVKNYDQFVGSPENLDVMKIVTRYGKI